MTKKKDGDNVIDLTVTKTAKWMKSLMRTKTDALLNNVTNALIFLRHDADLKDAFGYDEMQRSEMLMHSLSDRKAKWTPRPAEDADAIAVQEMLQRRGMVGVTKATVFDAMEQRSRERSFHPVKDYLNSLPAHDGTPRLATWLSTYLGADDTPYTQAVGRMFLISMVARIMRPGCKADYTLILEGEQGAEKSKVGAILAGEWFSDSLPEIGQGKEASQHLRGKWLIEMAELHARGKAEINRLKAWMTRQTERYRPPFGRKEVSEPRQCVIMGTTNEEVYLSDATGNRRDWPVKIGNIDLAALTRDRDQLFAEAVAAYLAGDQWWPDREFEREEIQPEQEARFEVDVWEETLSDWLAAFLKEPGDKAKKCLSVGTILGWSDLNKEARDRSTNDQRRVTAILRRLGWRRSSKQGKGWLKGNHFWSPSGVSEEDALEAMDDEKPPLAGLTKF